MQVGCIISEVRLCVCFWLELRLRNIEGESLHANAAFSCVNCEICKLQVTVSSDFLLILRIFLC